MSLGFRPDVSQNLQGPADFSPKHSVDYQDQVSSSVWGSYTETGAPDNLWHSRHYLCYHYASELACRIKDEDINKELVIVGLRDRTITPEHNLRTAEPGDIIQFYGSDNERQHTVVVMSRYNEGGFLVSEAKETNGQGGRLLLYTQCLLEANQDYGTLLAEIGRAHV